ncbi:MAG: hypothetical protein SO141_01950 [Alphaproteobacteria bacterium]|nr:hypothetical protein [Alphaproteobacteria bacterium]
MNSENFYKYATGIALVIFGFLSYNYYQRTNPYQPACNVNISYISNTIQDWMRERISENNLKTNKLEIVDIDGFAEYNTIPHWDKVPLYEDFKHSTICKATVVVDFAPITKAKKVEENEDGVDNSKDLEEISIRYQLVSGAGIRMSGVDVEDMMEQVKNAMNKHKKK